MKVFNCIFGVFAIFGAIYCIFYPSLTFINSGWLLSILLGIWGICGIFEYATTKNTPNHSNSVGAMGTVGLVFGIIATVLSICAVFIPSVQLMFDFSILCLFASWLVISGIVTAVTAVNAKKNTTGKGWIFSLILGILVLLSGIYGFFHLLFIAQAIGILIGVLLMLYGVRLICSVFENNN